MMYYGDALVNETNAILSSTTGILKILLSQSTYLLFVLELYVHEALMKLAVKKLPSKIAHRQISSLKVSCINVVL